MRSTGWGSGVCVCVCVSLVGPFLTMSPISRKGLWDFMKVTDRIVGKMMMDRRVRQV